MKIINAEENKQIFTLPTGRATLVYAKLIQLQPGEALLLNRDEWKAKYNPSTLAGRAGKKLKRKFKCASLIDNSGWKIERLE